MSEEDLNSTADDELQLAELKTRFGFEEWGESDRPEPGVFVWALAFSGKELPGWRLSHLRQDPPEEWPRWINSVWEQPSAEEDLLLRVEVIETVSRLAAGESLLRLLAEVQTAEIERSEAPDIGEVYFSMPGGQAAFFRRGNLVFRVRNAAQTTMPVESISRTMDQLVTAEALEPTSQVSPEIRMFSCRPERLATGEPGALTFEASDPLDRPLWYKLFSEGGQVEFEDRQLLYRPERAGAHEVKLVVVNPDLTSAGRALTIKVT